MSEHGPTGHPDGAPIVSPWPAPVSVPPPPSVTSGFYAAAPPLPPGSDANVTGKSVLALSWAALREDRELIALPALGALGTIIVGAAFFVPAVLAGMFDTSTGKVTGAGYVYGAVVGLILTSIGMFFQVALVAGALERINGGTPTLRGAMATAWTRRRAILSWAVLFSIIGTILRAIERRFGAAGRLLNLVGGVGFSVASYFVAPIIAAEGLSAWPALKRSAGLMSQRWGKVLRTGLRLGVIALLVTIVALVISAALVALAFAASTAVGIVVLTIAVVAFIVAMFVLNAVQGYARAVLYQYSLTGSVAGYSSFMLQNAMRVKSKR